MVEKMRFILLALETKNNSGNPKKKSFRLPECYFVLPNHFPRTRKQAIPATQFTIAPTFRQPRHLRGTVHAFGVRHHDGNAPVCGGNARDALR